MGTQNMQFYREIFQNFYQIPSCTGQQRRLMFKHTNNLSLVMRKPAFCICKNKNADQLGGKSKADQRLCFRYLDSTIPLLSKSEILSFQTSVAVQPGLCLTWSDTPKTGFLTTRLIWAISRESLQYAHAGSSVSFLFAAYNN